MSIEEAFREHRTTLAGRIVIAGSVINLLLAAFYAWKAWKIFPGPGIEDFSGIALLCAAIPVSLVGTWVRYGRRFQYQPNTLLTVLLLLISALPLLFASLLV